MQAQEPAELGELDETEPDGLGLLNVENLSCLCPLPHLGQATRSPIERTRCSKVVSQSWQVYS